MCKILSLNCHTLWLIYSVRKKNIIISKKKQWLQDELIVYSCCSIVTNTKRMMINEVGVKDAMYNTIAHTVDLNVKIKYLTIKIRDRNQK